MSTTIQNMTRRLVLLRLNSGETLFLEPGGLSRTIEDRELNHNTMLQKLRERKIISIHKAQLRSSKPARKSAKRSAEESAGRESKPRGGK